MENIRQPAVANRFYPGDADQLAHAVDAFLSTKPESANDRPATPPKILIVPHAGYIYSGATAGRAYALLKPWRSVIKRVVLLAPLHRVLVRGIALPEVLNYNTPLGNIPIDRVGLDSLAQLPWAVKSDLAHAEEHSLEVHLPFLQRALDDFELIPIGVGPCPVAPLAERIEQLWGGRETLIVVSTDLSHYLPYAQAQAKDRLTCERILNADADIDPESACGAYPLNAILHIARHRHLGIHLLEQCNSGDGPGNKARVVGYAAFALYETSFDAEATTLGLGLLHLARQAIDQRFNPAEPARFIPAPALAKRLAEPGASFVTLTLGGHLRGCIGTLHAQRKLLEDIEKNALAAAFRDPRFPPLSAAEWARTQLEVSLLGEAQPLHFINEADALKQLRPGIDGLILSSGTHRATFLPQVWSQLPTPAEFMARLKQKAGLPADYWGDDIQLARYTVQKWHEDA